jgi:hypothetical protein
VKAMALAALAGMLTTLAVTKPGAVGALKWKVKSAFGGKAACSQEKGGGKSLAAHAAGKSCPKGK